MVVFGSTAYVYAQIYDCLNPPLWIKGPNFSFEYCFGLLLDGNITKYKRNLHYDSLCATSFWMNVSEMPNEDHVTQEILDALRIQGLGFTEENISFWNDGSVFVVNVKGDWEENSSVVISLIDVLEGIDGVVSVDETRIACA